MTFFFCQVINYKKGALLARAKEQGRSVQFYEEYYKFIEDAPKDIRGYLFAQKKDDSEETTPMWPLTASMMEHFLWWLKMPRARTNVGIHSPELSLTDATHAMTQLISFIEDKEATPRLSGQFADPNLLEAYKKDHVDWLKAVAR